LEPGLISVDYRDEEGLDPTKQGPLVDAVEQQCALGFVAVVFEVTGARRIDVAVPEMWLKVTGRLSPALCAMAVASRSIAVRVAADAFGISNVLRRVPIAVKSFIELDAAQRWARESLAAKRKAP
jgi:hypothetical protein